MIMATSPYSSMDHPPPARPGMPAVPSTYPFSIQTTRPEPEMTTEEVIKKIVQFFLITGFGIGIPASGGAMFSNSAVGGRITNTPLFSSSIAMMAIPLLGLVGSYYWRTPSQSRWSKCLITISLILSLILDSLFISSTLQADPKPNPK